MTKQTVTLPAGIYFIGCLDQVFSDENVNKILEDMQDEGAFRTTKFGVNCVSTIMGSAIFVGACNIYYEKITDTEGTEYLTDGAHPFLACMPIELLKIDNKIQEDEAVDVGRIETFTQPFECTHDKGEFIIDEINISSNWKKCDHCCEEYHIEDLYEGLCENCRCYCEGCDGVFPCEDLDEDGRCEDCALLECEVCNRYFSQSEMMDDGVCYSCHAQCVSCQEDVRIDETHTLSNGDVYCDDCYDDLLPCAGCEEMYEPDNLIAKGDDLYCKECFDDLEDEE